MDVVIIGGGVVGTAIARVLSRYHLQVALIEREADLAAGASGSNSGIVHAGFDPVPGTLKARLNLRGNQLMADLCQELKVPYKNNGSLVVATREEDLPTLEELRERGRKNGVMGLEIWGRYQLKGREPNISSRAVAALWAPTGGIVCPYSLTIALAENAAQNGVIVKTGVAATGLLKQGNAVVGLKTSAGEIPCSYVINCAGVWSDIISDWAEPGLFKISPYKGEYCLLDKKAGHLVKSTIFPVPSKLTKGILVSPTTHGNIIVGPNRTSPDGREDNSTTRAGLDEVWQGAQMMVDNLRKDQIIATFAGIRAVADSGEFEIGTTSLQGFINVGGIQSPGLTAAPAIAEMVCDILREEGLVLKPKIDFVPERKEYFRFDYHYPDRVNKLIKEHPEYGDMVCRCESVSAGEISDAIHRPIPAVTMDAIKRRTRAGMGRCQGGFCSHRVIKLIARETGIPVEQVTKKGPGSEVVRLREE